MQSNDITEKLHRSLVSLKISKVKCDELHTALEKLSGLISLEVVNGRESLDLSVASECCPKLQSLQVFYSRGVHISSSQGLRFPNLRKLTIYATEARSVLDPWIHHLDH